MMTRRTIVARTQVRALGEDEVEVIVSTDNLVAQDGLVLDPAGCVLDNYRRNPIWLWSHDPDVPIGRAEQITVEPNQIRHRVRFAKPGISAKADEIRGLVKDSIVSAASVGFDFDPADAEPIDPKRPHGGRFVRRWELFESSFVAVPADPAALVTARSHQAKRSDMADWKCGAARNLPIEDGDPAWDGDAAARAIFDHAGGDDFDPAIARKGFLAYDAAAPKERGSYKLPFVHISDSKMVVPKSALRAASGAHGVDAAEIGDAKDEAKQVLDAYKKKAGVGDDSEHSRHPRRRHRIARGRHGTRAFKLRGMYGVGQLAYLLDCVAWAKTDAEIESALEGDASKVPGMLKQNLADLGETLIAMTIEEVSELVEDDDDTDVTEGLSDDEIVIVQQAKTPAAQRFRAGFFRARAAVMAARAGKALSAANAEHLQEVGTHHKRALEHHAEAVDCHAAIGEHHRGIETAHEKARAAHDDLADELAKGGECDAERCQRAARAIRRNLDAIADHNTGLGDEHEEMGDHHRGVARSIRAADRCLREVDGFGDDDDGRAGNPGASEDGSSGGDEGAHSADFRRRQAELLALAAA